MKYLFATLFLFTTASAQAQQSIEYETKYDCRNTHCVLGCALKEKTEPGLYTKAPLAGNATIKILGSSATIVEIQENRNGGRIETWTLPAGSTCKIL